MNPSASSPSRGTKSNAGAVGGNDEILGRGLDLPTALAALATAATALQRLAISFDDLSAARDIDVRTARVLALRYFAGLRSAEMNRLEEEDIRLDRGFIEVPAVKSKTRQRRLVMIQPNLRAWLDLEGTLPGDQEKRVSKVVLASGVEWPRNVTRHSFVSYHLAQFQSAGKTALEAGHSEQMLFQHYREVVTPADAIAFWGIVP